MIRPTTAVQTTWTKKKIKIRQFNTKSKNYKGNFMSFVKYDKESREVDFTTGNPSCQVLEELNIKWLQEVLKKYF